MFLVFGVLVSAVLPASLLFSGQRDHSPRESIGTDVKLRTLVYPVLKLRMAYLGPFFGLHGVLPS
jgi:hypothetical protein